jgi:hypothetical protein
MRFLISAIRSKAQRLRTGNNSVVFSRNGRFSQTEAGPMDMMAKLDQLD